jgi:hypothetical protein
MTLNERPERRSTLRSQVEQTNPLQEEYLSTLQDKQGSGSVYRPELYANTGPPERPQQGTAGWVAEQVLSSRRTRDPEQAENRLRDAMQTADRLGMNRGHITSASIRSELAGILLKLQPPRHEEAARLLQESLRQQEQMRRGGDLHTQESVAPSSPLAIQTNFLLGHALRGLGRTEESNTHFREAVQGVQQAQRHQTQLDNFQNTELPDGRPRPGMPANPKRLDGREIRMSVDPRQARHVEPYSLAGDIGLYDQSGQQTVRDMAASLTSLGGPDNIANAMSLIQILQSSNARLAYFERHGTWPQR